MRFPSLPPPPPSWRAPRGARRVTAFTLAAGWLWVMGQDQIGVPMAIVGTVLIAALAVLTRQW